MGQFSNIISKFKLKNKKFIDLKYYDIKKDYFLNIISNYFLIAIKSYVFQIKHASLDSVSIFEIKFFTGFNSNNFIKNKLKKKLSLQKKKTLFKKKDFFIFSSNFFLKQNVLLNLEELKKKKLSEEEKELIRYIKKKLSLQKKKTLFKKNSLNLTTSTLRMLLFFLENNKKLKKNFLKFFLLQKELFNKKLLKIISFYLYNLGISKEKKKIILKLKRISLLSEVLKWSKQSIFLKDLKRRKSKTIFKNLWFEVLKKRIFFFKNNKMFSNDFFSFCILFFASKIKPEWFLLLFGKMFARIQKKGQKRFLLSFRNLCKTCIILFSRMGKNRALGIKFKISGRLRGQLRAKTFSFKYGVIPLQSFDKSLKYVNLPLKTRRYGMYGLKLWLNIK